jgi:hypothetical protein
MPENIEGQPRIWGCEKSHKVTDKKRWNIVRHEKYCGTITSKKRQRLKVDGEYVCRLHEKPLKFYDYQDHRCHLSLFHRTTPTKFLQVEFINPELIKKIPPAAKMSFARYVFLRSQMVLYIEET